MTQPTLIEQFYMDESSEQYEESMTKTISVKLTIDHASMLKALCDRFNKPLSGLSGEILERAIYDMVIQLSDDDLKALCDKADDISGDYYKEKGIKSEWVGIKGKTVDKPQHWASQEWAIMEGRKASRATKKGDKK